MEYAIYRSEADYLQHWGIKGQKWGVRRFENPDGTLTEEGKIRYGVSGNNRNGNAKLDKAFQKDSKKLAKLEYDADLNTQKELADKKAKSAKQTGLAAIAALMAAIGANKLPPLSETTAHQTTWTSIPGYGSSGTMRSSYKTPSSTLNEVITVVGLASAAGLATKSIVDAGQSRIARRKASATGHYTAVTKRDRQIERMQNKYRGTNYENKINVNWGVKS